MPLEPQIPDELNDLVRAGARAAREVPGSIATGGTVVGLYARHRISIDIDFVVPDLIARFDSVQQHLLEDVAGWKEERVRRPVLILGSLDKFPIGFRQQRRKTPIQTKIVMTADGPLIIPTIEELLLVKAMLAYERNRTRDFVDIVELSSQIGLSAAAETLACADQLMAWEKQPAVALEIAKTLAQCEPMDLDSGGFGQLKLLHPRHCMWESVRSSCVSLAAELSMRLIKDVP